MSWRAILDGDDARRAREILVAIECELADRTIDDPSLGNGHAGAALLHGYRAIDGVEDAGDRALESLECALAAIDQSPEPWLFNGFAGIAFAICHLEPVVGDNEEVLQQLDSLVAETVDNFTEPSWELMFGLVGLGIYAIERHRLDIVERIVERLDGCAVRDDSGARWLATNPARHEAGLQLNLGIPHGVAGVVGFLAEACLAGVSRATPLAGDAARWLRSQDRQFGVPRFPSLVDPRGLAFDGWCYGDAATAIELGQAGRSLHDHELVSFARELARSVARRTESQLEAFVVDTCLCHGSLGQAHLLGRLGQAFVDNELCDAARRWFERTLARLDDKTIRGMEVGLRGGLTGIALGLHAAVTTTEPRWDRAFLLALPAGSVTQDSVERG